MARSDTHFDATALRQRLPLIDAGGRYVVALSGGADSTALAVALAALAEELEPPPAALHVNHGVHADADRWEAQCRGLCERLGLELKCLRVTPDPDSRRGPEAEWRARRYRAMAGELGSADILLTAHHREDQAETVLLHLLRGSGPEGLAGIPASRPLGPARLARPLLDVPGETLKGFLRREGVDWIEDPGNDDTALDRNYLRHQLLPVLRKRWPGADATLARSARYQAESADVMRQLAGELLAPLRHDGAVLPLAPFRGRPAPLLKVVLREWIRRRGLAPIPAARLEAFCEQLRQPRPDAAVTLAWKDHRLRLYRDALWLSEDTAESGGFSLQWPDTGRADLGPVAGTLTLAPASALGPGPAWRVASRSGGERYRNRPGGPHRAVKDLLREAGVPPWLRPAVPLLLESGQVIAVGDWLLAEELRQRLRAHDATLHWRPRDPVLDRLRRQLHGSGTPVESGPGVG